MNKETEKVFNTMQNIGKAKYVVNYHNGIRTNIDGSPFFDIATFKSKWKYNAFIASLRTSGYKEQ